jgi:hypothetical protein
VLISGAGVDNDGSLAPGDDIGASRAAPALTQSPGEPATGSPEQALTDAHTAAPTEPASADTLFTHVVPFAPLRELARDTWERVESALPELSLPEDLGSDDAPELWQVGVCLVTAATVWAVAPRRSRSRSAVPGAGAAYPEAGVWPERDWS